MNGAIIGILGKACTPEDFPPTPTLVVDSGFDAFERARAAIELERRRRQGATVFLISHDEELLLRLADEVWWYEGGELEARGDPREVLERYRRRAAERLREWGRDQEAPVQPSLRRGDGRAELLAVETLGADGHPSMVLRSGERCAVRVTVRFRQPVPDPVVGIMIRTRVGFEVYGTNTELEQVKLGPCAAGSTIRVEYAFDCRLCPGEYTITAASHDPDGVWHDWAEDAVAFSVADSRYTAGVADLRARVSVTPL